MNDNTFRPNTGRRALSRTFRVLTVERQYDVVVDVAYNIVVLSRAATGLVATVNGHPVAVDYAVYLLETTKQGEMLSEVLMPEPEVVAAPIGKPLAHQLHIEMGRIGYRTSAQHYNVAAEILSRPVTSLAALTHDEYTLVREYAYGQLGLVAGVAA